MAHNDSVRRYRGWYARLLRLYSKPYYERFAEGMEQTFHDLLRERKRSGRGLFGFALWMFVETSAGIVRENVRDAILKSKSILRLAIVTACILLVPFVAMQFSDEMKWGLGDFVFAGTLIFGAGLTYELVAKRKGSSAYRFAVGLAVATALLLVWLNLAVGIIGSEDNPVNVMYVGVLVVGIVGATIARLQPRGMARALFATAIAQMLVPVIALIAWRSLIPASIVGVFVLNGLFGALFVSSGLLFQRASATSTK